MLIRAFIKFIKQILHNLKLLFKTFKIFLFKNSIGKFLLTMSKIIRQIIHLLQYIKLNSKTQAENAYFSKILIKFAHKTQSKSWKRHLQTKDRTEDIIKKLLIEIPIYNQHLKQNSKPNFASKFLYAKKAKEINESYLNENDSYKFLFIERYKYLTKHCSKAEKLNIIDLIVETILNSIQLMFCIGIFGLLTLSFFINLGLRICDERVENLEEVFEKIKSLVLDIREKFVEQKDSYISLI